MKLELDKLVFIFKGDMKSGYCPPAQHVVPHKVNFRSRKISCDLMAPNHRHGRYRTCIGFDRFIVCDANDMATVLYLEEQNEKK